MFARALDAIGRQTISVFEGVGRASMLLSKRVFGSFAHPIALISYSRRWNLSALEAYSSSF